MEGDEREIRTTVVEPVISKLRFWFCPAANRKKTVRVQLSEELGLTLMQRETASAFVLMSENGSNKVLLLCDLNTMTSHSAERSSTDTPSHPVRVRVDMCWCGGVINHVNLLSCRNLTVTVYCFDTDWSAETQTHTCVCTCEDLS